MAHEIAGQESPGLTVIAEIRNAYPIPVDGNRWCLIGEIYNDTRGRFNDGHLIRTTPIEEFFTPDVLRTKNTTYRVIFHGSFKAGATSFDRFTKDLNYGN